jgi:hypothetical protein
MTAAPVITPLLQWSDADGNPYAGGTIESYMVGTSTPKAIWVDPDQTALATNPVVLDAAGRSLMFGDGSYRLILRDAAGNQVADFVATTLVSAAMYPVVSAPTIADALNLLGIDDLIAAEAAARAAADSAEQTARIAADNAEAAARAAADTTLQTNINTLGDNAVAADAYLQSQIDALVPGGTPAFQSGTATIGVPPATPTTGSVHITFPTPFATACDAVTCTCKNVNFPAGFDAYTAITFTVSGLTTSGADVFAYGAGSPSGPCNVAIDFCWIAAGH